MQRMGPGVADWHDFLSDADRATIERGKWARRGGFGVRPALIVIDAQNYMVGEEGRAGRPPNVPVFYTRFAIDPVVAMPAASIPAAQTRRARHHQEEIERLFRSWFLGHKFVSRGGPD